MQNTKITKQTESERIYHLQTNTKRNTKRNSLDKKKMFIKGSTEIQ